MSTIHDVSSTFILHEWQREHKLRISHNKVQHVHLLNVVGIHPSLNVKVKSKHAIQAQWGVYVTDS